MTKVGQVYSYATELDKSRTEVLSQPNSLENARLCQEKEATSAKQSPEFVQPVTNHPPTSIEEHVASVISNGSDTQTLQVLNEFQAPPKKKKKIRVVQ